MHLKRAACNKRGISVLHRPSPIKRICIYTYNENDLGIKYGRGFRQYFLGVNGGIREGSYWRLIP
jgi:hypothetical protein